MTFEQYFPMGASFLFVFAIVYALLLKSSILGQAKNASVIVAFVIAAFSVVYGPVATFLLEILPTAAIILVILFVIAFAKDILGLKGGERGDVLPEIALLIISLLVLAGIAPRLENVITFADPTTVMFVGGVVVTLLIFYAIYKQQ